MRGVKKNITVASRYGVIISDNISLWLIGVIPTYAFYPLRSIVGG